MSAPISSSQQLESIIKEIESELCTGVSRIGAGGMAFSPDAAELILPQVLDIRKNDPNSKFKVEVVNSIHKLPGPEYVLVGHFYESAEDAEAAACYHADHGDGKRTMGSITEDTNVDYYARAVAVDSAKPA